MIALYLCDGKKCDVCHKQCKHTIDIEHAINFEKYGATFFEKEFADKEKTKELTINDFAADVHVLAVKSGWWENPLSFPEIIALCHSELSEALQEDREGNPMQWYSCPLADGAVDKTCCEDMCEYYGGGGTCENSVCDADRKLLKPEGVAVEMADCILRIFDWAAANKIDLESILKEKNEYNKTREYKHGGKKY